MSVFAKAASKTSNKPKAKKSKGTTWSVGSDEATGPVAKAIGQIAVLNAEKKKTETKLTAHKAVVLRHAKTQFCQTYAANSVFPDTPMKVVNPDGASATLVVQERNQYGVSDDSVEALTQILGEDGVDDMVYEETVFGFDRGILARDGVMDILGKHIEAAMAEMVETETLDGEAVEDLLTAKEKRSYRPGVMQRLAAICGNDTTKMAQVCEAMGSGCVQYVK